MFSSLRRRVSKIFSLSVRLTSPRNWTTSSDNFLICALLIRSLSISFLVFFGFLASAVNLLKTHTLTLITDFHF